MTSWRPSYWWPSAGWPSSCVVPEVVAGGHVLVPVRVGLGELVLGVVPGRLELGLGRDRDVGAEPRLGEPGTDLHQRVLAGGDPVGVGLGRGHVDLVLVPAGEGVALALGDGEVPLGVGALRGAHDDAALVAVQEPRLVRPLERDAPATGEPERDRRQHEDRDPHEVGDGVQVEVEDHREDVVAAGSPQQAVQRHHRDQERRPVGGVARSLEQVVLALVAGDPLLDERVDQDPGEDEDREDLAGQQRRSS